MHVTIVTSVLNGAKTLRRCIDSVASQTYLCEHIIVDGGSTDGSQKLVLESGNSNVHLIEAPGTGISEAFNIGIQHSSGEFIAILNADDWLEKDAVELSEKCLQLNPNAGFTYGSVMVHDHGQTIVSDPAAMPDRLLDAVRQQMPFCHISSLVRRSVYEQCGYYDPSFNVVMDHDFYARVLNLGVKGVYVSGVLGHVLGGGNSSDDKRRISDSYRVSRRYLGKIPAVLVSTRFHVNSLIINFLMCRPATRKLVNMLHLRYTTWHQ